MPAADRARAQSIMVTAHDIIRHLRLEPLPDEGGLFRRAYRASEDHPSGSLPARYRGSRPHGSAIYYLLTDESDSFSALHRLRTDEVYHFYLGDPVALTLLHPDGRSEVRVLGPDLLNGQHVQTVVKRGTWQGSRLVPDGAWALLGTTMAPGFDAADFELGDRARLIERYPDQEKTIGSLTRGTPHLD